MKTAHILVDYQNDFAHPNGTLYVGGGEKLLPTINSLMETLSKKGISTIATKDRHQEGLYSFASTHNKKPLERDNDHITLLRPDHCIQGTRGAEFIQGLKEDSISQIVYKDYMGKEHIYSGFGKTNLNEVLIEQGVKSVIVTGLATDYCIKATALDAVQNGYKTTVITDAIAGVAPETTEQALEEMRKAGVKLMISEELFAMLDR